MANTGTGTFDFDQALRDMQAAPAAYSAGMTALALADRNRRQQLEDTASQQQFRREENVTEQKFRREQTKEALKANLKLMEEAELNRIRSKAADVRIPVKKDGAWRPIEDVQADMGKAEEDKAQTTWDFYTGQLKDITVRADETAERFAKVGSSGAPTALKQEALRTTVTSPAMAKILSGTQMKLAMDAANDPKISSASLDRVVEETRKSLAKDYSKFHLFGIGGNFWQETAGNNAATFQMAYATALGGPVEKNKLAQWQFLMKQSGDIEDQRLKLLGNMSSHVSQFRNMLPKDTVKGFKEWRGLGVPKELTPAQQEDLNKFKIPPTVAGNVVVNPAEWTAPNAPVRAIVPQPVAQTGSDAFGVQGAMRSLGSASGSGVRDALDWLNRQGPGAGPVTPSVPSLAPQNNVTPVAPPTADKPILLNQQQVEGVKQFAKSLGATEEQIAKHAADMDSPNLAVRANAIRNFNVIASKYLETLDGGGESMFANTVPNSMPGTAPVYRAPYSAPVYA